MEKIQIGQILDRKYEIINYLGEGGFGVVVRARNLEDNIDIALKYCSKDDKESLKRFAREIRITKNINHENVIKILDHNLDHTPPYFTMPLASKNLTEIIPSLIDNENESLKIFKKICNGVNAIHLTGSYHRDIKPNNVLLYEDGLIVVSDLGLARLEVRDTTSITISNEFLGTWGYDAPEQFSTVKEADVRTDIYQLGKTLYQILTNEIPYLLNPDKISKGLFYLIQKATRTYPHERFQSVGELLDSISDYEAAKEPNSNPEISFNELLKQAQIILDRKEYDSGNLRKIISVLITIKDDPNTFLELFDKIPNIILKTMASHLTGDFKPLLIEYGINLNSYFTKNSTYPFSYADTVASTMASIYYSTDDLDVKSLSLKCILIASIMCNRFYAMDVFDKIIKSITNDEEALAIANMLREEIDFYKNSFERIEKKDLHSTLRKVWELAKQKSA